MRGRRIPRPSLRTRLILVVIACVLPLSALHLGMQFVNYREARKAAEQRTLELARGLSLALEREVQARIALLGVLAQSRRLQEGDLAGFRSQAEAVVTQYLLPGAVILLLREDGQQVMNTALPPDVPLPARRNLESIRRVFDTARPSVSSLFRGATEDQEGVAMEVPVLRRDGGVAYVLALHPPIELFFRIIRRQRPTEGWVIALRDGEGNAVARVPEDFIGQPPTSDLLAHLQAAPEGIVETPSLEGVPMLVAFSRTENFGWSAAVGVPLATLTAALQRDALGTLTAGLTLLLAGLLLAGTMARRITGPIAALRRLAAMADGELLAEPLAQGLPETAEVAEALATAARQRRQAESRLRLALEAGAVGIFDRDLRNGSLRWDERMRAIWAVPQGAAADLATFHAGIHIEDRARVAALFNAPRLGGDDFFNVECRVIGLADGVQRAVALRGRVTIEGGRPTRVVGTVIDITERRIAEERQTLLAREVDHRAKNVLAVVQSVVRLTPRSLPPQDFAASVEGRITAMARAHSLLAAAHWVGAELRAVAEGELAVHAGGTRIEGPPARLAPGVVQPMGMLLHELATNAAKHGALSQPGGTVGLCWTFDIDAALWLRWVERGGPEIAGPPTRPGFGMRLIATLAERQLDGVLHREWLPTGLQLTLTVPAKHIQRSNPGASRREDRPARPPEGSPAPVLTGPGGRPPRVLLVEDETLLALELEQGLRALGCHVIGPARSLAEAVRLAAGQPRPDAAVLDVNLGGEMVFPAADLLATRGVPVLFATGYGSAPVPEGSTVKAVAVLQKPFTMELLADALSRALLRTEGAGS